jgi:hypothetical protein
MSQEVYAPDGTLLGTVRPDPWGPCWVAVATGCAQGVRLVDEFAAWDWLLLWSDRLD